MTDSSLSSASDADVPQAAHLLPPGSALPPSSATPIAATLRHFSIFADLDDAQRERLASQMQPLMVPARTILLAAGQPGHAVYFLLEGTVKIGLERPAGPRTQKLFGLGGKEPEETPAAASATGAPASGAPTSGAQVMLKLCGPGAILGALSLIDGRGHSANVVTRGTCRLLWIDKDAFLEAVDQMPGLSLALLRECSARLRNATHQLHAFATLDATGRIAHALLRLGELMGTQTPEGLRLDIGLSQSELADLTGLTRVRVNTVTAQFKARRWLSLESNGALLLRDTPSLAGVAHLTLPAA